MTRTIVFVHGAWVTPACWGPFQRYFEARGYTCLAPAWPGKDRPLEEIRADPSPLRGLGLGELAAHHEALVRRLEEPPILIGHSFGGLLVQVLLDRGLGAAGVAIHPAPPNGVFALQPTTVRSLASVLLTPLGWRKVVHWSFEDFRYAFVDGLPPAEQRAAFDDHVTPESGRIFFQGALAWLRPGGPCRVEFAKADRAPLLIVAGSADRIVPAATNRRAFAKYRRSQARTDYLELAGRTHWTIAQTGWQHVAGSIGTWLEERDLGATA